MERQQEQNTSFTRTRQPMIVFSAMRDFADGLTRGLSLFLTERNDMTARTFSPAPSRKGKAAQ
jgi:hypothetical protein